MEKVNFLSPQEVLRACQAGGRGQGLQSEARMRKNRIFSTRSPPGPDVRPVLVFLVPRCLQRLPRVAPSWPDMNHSKPPDRPHIKQMAWATNVSP